MPAILRSRPDAVYVVLGATHPNLVREKGEAYRESLVARASKLGINDHVVFLDQFVDQTTLLGFISMCDVYVTPDLNPAQMTSGTLAYSPRCSDESSRAGLFARSRPNAKGMCPNVVYTCGAMRQKSRIVVPYAVSDTFSTVWDHRDRRASEDAP